MRRATQNWSDKQIAVRNYYKQLQKDTDVTQTTVTNHTNDVRKVCLWGAISCVPLTDPMTIDESVKATLNVAGHPQAMVYNPANDRFYVVNQLSDSVSIISSDGQLLNTIELSSSLLPGTISPVDIAVNDNINSYGYGEIAVACSVSDEVVIISLQDQIVRRLATDKRPVSIAFNKINGCYYVANVVTGSVSKVCASGITNKLFIIEQARSIGTHPKTGDIYVFSSLTQQVQIYTNEDASRGSYGPLATESVQFAYHPINKTMYIVSDSLGQVDVLNTSRLRAVATIKLDKYPTAIAFNPHKGLMYVLTRDDQKIVPFGIKNQITERFDLTDFNLGFAISTKKDIVAFSNSNNDTVSVFGEQSGPTVTVNEDYYEDREDFQHNPTLISHVKIVASGNDRINAMQLIEKSAAGKERCQTLSLSNHQSPQNFGNISEVFDMDSEIIDGHTIWCFKINPKQVVTFLIYHKQFEMYNVLPEKSRISTGVQMSKGIPASWLDNLNNEPPDESTY